MRFLADTHVVIWWLLDAPELADEVKELLDTEQHAYVSAVTPWELSVKQALGRLDGPADLPERSADCQLKPLPITAEHAMRAGRLPSTTATPSTACSSRRPRPRS